MQNNQCEKCKRTIETDALIKIERDHHIGYVCTTCHYIVSKEQYKEGFKQMVREKTFEQSNSDMQKVHLLLSGLIKVGLVSFIVMASGLALFTLGEFPTVDVLFSNIFNLLRK